MRREHRDYIRRIGTSVEGWQREIARGGRLSAEKRNVTVRSRGKGSNDIGYPGTPEELD